MESSFLGSNDLYDQNDNTSPFQHCLAIADTSTESFTDASILFDLNPPFSSLTTTICCHFTCHHSLAWEPTSFEDTSKENKDSLDLKKINSSLSTSKRCHQRGWRGININRQQEGRCPSPCFLWTILEHLKR